MNTKIEYRVRPVTRYFVTRYESAADNAESNAPNSRSTQHGEFDNFETAYAVGYALCKQEHERLGYPLDDMRIQYPRQLIRGGQIGSGGLAGEASQAGPASTFEPARVARQASQ